MTRLLITGGRDFRDRNFVFRTLDAFHREIPIAVMISGACPSGVDRMCESWAASNGVQVEPYPARWEDTVTKPLRLKRDRQGRLYNALAGLLRNQRMLDKGMPTHALVFPGGPGTTHMHGRLLDAVKRGREIDVRCVQLEG